MTVSISNLSVQSSLTTALQGEQTQLTTLATQLSTQQKYGNLTDYNASDARSLIDLQSAATQKQAYINVINSVSNNLTVYNTTLTDLENIVTQAQALANNNPTYSATGAANLNIQATNYLRSATVDLNQQINGVYIYSGTRYNTAPVQDLSAMPTASLSSTIYTDNQTVPSYDSASTLTLGVSGGNTITVGGTVGTAQTASATVNGTVYSYTVQPGDTLDTVAAGLQGVLATAGIASSVTGPVITLTGGDTLNSAVATTTDAAAYVTSKATINTGDTVNYGITSNDPSMQQMVAGLRYLQAAGNATDPATYKADVAQASTLLTTALASLQSVNTSVAFNINLMTSEKSSQNSAITDLTNQVSNIQQVDVTQVSTEITALQTILQASYAVTGAIEKLSIVSYL